MTATKLKIACAAAALALSANAYAASPKISASIDSTVIEMGSRATITLNISDADHKGHMVNLPAPGTEAEALDYISVKADTFPGGYQYDILIQGFVPGDITFEPFRYASGADTASSGYLSLKIVPVELDSLETINPMASIVNVPRKWTDYIPDYVPWILLGAALLAIVIALIIMYKKNGTIIVRKPKPVDPYESAMTALRTLRDRKLAENGQEKEFYTALVDILRTYLDRRFAINAMEMSSTQILDSLKANPETRDNQPRIKQILEIADFVKFANVRPLPDDNIKTFNNVVKFVEDTKPVAPEEEKDEADDSKKKPQ